MSRTRTDRYSETIIIRTRGKLLARALAVVFIVAIVAQLLHSALARDIAGNEAPDFVLKGISGSNFRLSEYRSEIVALVFWASWCGDCGDGLKFLEGMQQSLGADGLRVLSVSFDGKADVAKEAAGPVTFPVLIDADGDVGRLYGVNHLPAVFLVDRSGKVRGAYEGHRASTQQALARELRALVAE